MKSKLPGKKCIALHWIANAFFCNGTSFRRVTKLTAWILMDLNKDLILSSELCIALLVGDFLAVSTQRSVLPFFCLHHSQNANSYGKEHYPRLY